LRFVERGDNAWWECGLGEGSKERVTWGGQCEAPCGASERLQRATMEPEGFVVRRKGSAARSAGQPGFNIARTARLWAAW
jgi:hypothetical protein